MNILFLCTGNSARSILAEALMNALSKGRVQAFSAGSNPTGHPNPYALSTLQHHGHTPEGYRSKRWDEFEGDAAPVMDVVITVCDSAASEPCPVWPGTPTSAHWGLPDPAAAADGPDAEAAFEAAYAALEQRITHALNAGLIQASPEERRVILQRAHQDTSS